VDYDENNFLSVLGTSFVKHCYHEDSKCLPRRFVVRWWRRCFTAHAWWYGLPSPRHT